MKTKINFSFKIFLSISVFLFLAGAVLAANDNEGFENLEFKKTFTFSDLSSGQKITAFSDDFKVIVPANILSTSSDNLSDSVDVSLQKINEEWPTPWNLIKLSDFYQFEIFSNLNKDVEVQIAYDSSLAANKYKQVFYYDRFSALWRPLESRDNPTGKYISAKVKFNFARLAVFSYSNVIISGHASWYKFKGGDFAASPDFPKGSKLRVYNTANNKFVDVVVNDYGPNRLLYPDRVVDLDKKAFAKIASTGAGLINVRIEPLYIAPDSNGETLGISAKGIGANPDLSVKAALIMRESDSKIIFSKNATTSLPIASLTKLVAIKTFLDINDNFKRLSEKVAYSTEDEKKNYLYCKPAEAARLKMKNGDVLTIKDLIYSSLVASTNNTVETLVRVSGISRDKFIAKMNENVKTWGATSAVFVEPTGLSPKNECSVKDYVAIVEKAATDSIMMRASATKKYTLYNINGQKSHTISHSNSLLGLYRYPITISKTGYLNEAGYCLANRIETKNDNLVVVTFGNKTRSASFKDSFDLINYGLANIN